MSSRSLQRSLGRIVSVARKEVRQLLRDRLTLGFVGLVPVAQLLLFGYAINQDIRQVPTAVVDQSQTEISRHLAGRLEATQTFRITDRVASEAEALDLLRRGEVKAVVVIPTDFARAYYRGRGARISIRVDATDPTLARAVRTSAGGLEDDLNRRAEAFAVGEEGGARRAPRNRSSFGAEAELVHTRQWRFSVLTYYNPELRTPVFVVPALLGVILTTTMLLMTSLSIVRERERGTFEFLIGTPIRRFELMIGKLFPYVVIGFAQIAFVLIVGLVLFRVPVEGSLVGFGFASVLFIAANLTLGLVISSVTKTQLQATQVCFFFFLPTVLLSGFMFPFDAMPRPAQWLGELLPLTHFVRIARGMLLRGSSLFDHLAEVGALALFCAVTLLLATRLFKKDLG